MTAGNSEMNSFMLNFFQLMHSGEIAQLTLECYGGQFYVNLRAALPPYPQQQYHEYHHQQQVPSPSRLRRQARREAAKNVKVQTSKSAQQSTSENTNATENDVPTPVKNVDVAVQATETSVTDSSEAVQTSLGETQQFPSIHVGQFTQSSRPEPHAENVHHTVQEQPQQARGMTAEQAVHTEPAVVSVGHEAFPHPHPHSPYPHKTHPGRYNYCCEHRCNTGRRRTNSGKQITDERLCCDHRCTS